MTSTRGVALIDMNAALPEHDAEMQLLLGEKLASLLAIPLLGWRGQDLPNDDCYLLPSDTVIGLEAIGRLGIGRAENFFGGAVPQPFMATKAISHPLIDEPRHVPEGWSAAFHARIKSSVLAGNTAFDLEDARHAATRLLHNGPVRIKPVRGRAGRGQQLIADQAELEACLDGQDAEEVKQWGLVFEEHLQRVATFSVGQVTVAGITASYFGTQRLTRDDNGHEVYGGSKLSIVRGGYAELQALPLDAQAREAIDQAQCYEQAALEIYGLIASRRNYDIAQGVDHSGCQRSGVLEQSWRLGGASAAELVALQALQQDPQLSQVCASTYESYSDDAPSGAQLLQRRYIAPHGTLSRYVKVETDGRT
ncbi:hypothetical protein M2262_002464 [Pseudomonas sp. BIGb0408]|uniref:ATP-grasp domain-containing protein n=1 Tax=Phytopseudomonas flavescens TaxID=29435 RepID=A0A7Y9XKH2_9GAMM|nr:MULTISPECIES: DUF3182 family protein [Pseudomonas]MCW2292414.1 hypothetical protein [Pseudomonas sp. BIGb0408]NYH73015.1 hypothetical protein [Pseudomonas flavescens]